LFGYSTTPNVFLIRETNHDEAQLVSVIMV